MSMSIVPKSSRFPVQRSGLDPSPELAARRATAPVSLLKLPFSFDVWLVTGHELARTVLNDAAGYSTDIRHMVGTAGASRQDDIGGLGFTDPPEHTRLRKLLTPEFTRRRLMRLQPRIDQIVQQRLDALEQAGPRVDLVSQFCHPVPFLVIRELLGVGYDSGLFQELGKARFDVSDGAVGSLKALGESRVHLLQEVRRQRVHPGEGLLGQIIRDHGDEVSDDELAGLADGVLTGGFETTASTMALGLILLLADPQRQRWLSDPAVVERTVEELLRYLSVVQLAFPRFAREDHELGGARIRKDDVVLVSLSAANRDPALGEQMEQFDPSRPPTPHLAFGYGFHRCVGSELARMELRTALPGVLNRFPDMHLAVPLAELDFRAMALVYGVDELPVLLR